MPLVQQVNEVEMEMTTIWGHMGQMELQPNASFRLVHVVSQKLRYMTKDNCS